MIRFLISLFLFFLMLCVEAQNLIPNPSGEELIECPEYLGQVDGFVQNWQQFRGSSDYFNSCTENSLLGWNSVIGYQQPRTGDGYFGCIAYHPTLPNTREYFGLELNEPMTIGDTYYISYYISLAYRYNTCNKTCNNLGVLFVTNDYLDIEDQGNIINFSHFHSENFLSDTTNWTEQSFVFVADSAYTSVVFGNFYDDESTEVIDLFPKEEHALAYFYFDDFCISSSPNCETTSIKEKQQESIKVHPNPSSGRFFVESHKEDITQLYIYSITGEMIDLYPSINQRSILINSSLPSGVYILIAKTRKGFIRKRVIVQNK